MISKKTSFYRIHGRQDDDRWGADYQPAIRATREEGPSISYLLQLYSRKLGRSLHLLSTPEAIMTHLALYHPDVYEVHEQKMLDPSPRLHPLHQRNRIRGAYLPSFRGTAKVAESLDLLEYHPTVYLDDDDGNSRETPYPMVGDLLLYIKNEDAPAYCVNWTVKDCLEAFGENKRRSFKTASALINDQRKAYARHRIEEQYYLDAGIRTVRLAPSLVDQTVFHNLHTCHASDVRTVDLPLSISEDFLDEVKEKLDNVPLYQTVNKYSANGNDLQFVTLFYAAIWNRIIKVDLFAPILIDRPVRSQRRDILDVYSEYFAEHK